MSLLRQCPLPIYDVLEGCRQLLGTGYSAEQYRCVVEAYLNDFFFTPDVAWERAVGRQLDVTDAQLSALRHYIVPLLANRIQRSFGLLYPNRTYDWVFDVNLGVVLLREFDTTSTLNHAPILQTEEPTHDICDDWVPERQRRR